MDFGENLKRLREQRGLSQQELGSMANLSQPAIFNFECGKINPKPKTIGDLATALNVTTDRLIFGEAEHLFKKE